MHFEEPFWVPSAQFIITKLDTSAQGLDDHDVQKRQKKYGLNIIDGEQKHAIFFQLLSRFQNPLIVLLLVACVLSAFAKETHSAVLILLMVLFSVGLDFIQEYRANQSAEALKKSVALKTTLIRQGEAKEMLASELVPGDLVTLSAGDLIPADGRLLYANGLFVNQALLTGESFPVTKMPSDTIHEVHDLTQVSNALFMGSSVISGEGRMIVCQTGRLTFLGKIANVLKRCPPPSAFELGIKQFGYLLMRLTLFLSFFVLVVNLLLGKPFLETVLFALALAVGMTPELLPMVISVTLARGSLRMAKKMVIVKRLSAIHDLGSMDVLCTDKTGTLTQATIKLAQHLDTQGQQSPHVLELSYLNSYFESGIKSQLDNAVIESDSISTEAWQKIDEIPFDAERRKISVLLDNGVKRLLIVKGAPEDVLLACSAFEHDNKVLPLDEIQHKQLLHLFHEQSREGLRVLGIAWQSAPDMTSIPRDLSGLVFAGFATFFDPPKESARQALKLLSDNHIQLKIISGDNEYVTMHLCHDLGIPVQGILKGSDMADMSNEALCASVEKTNLFCRVTPAQKTQIIEALKQRGHIVGFMGDGVNDAPALHMAHIGISIDTAVDVAKEAADLILLKQDLRVVNVGVIEGRRTYGNIMKYIMMVTSSSFGNMLSMAGASLFIPFLPMRASQILLNNLLYDLSEVAIPLDHVDPEVLARPRPWSMSLITKFMLILGPISSVFDFIIFYIMLKVMHAHEALFQTAWFVESLTTQILVIFVIRTRFSLFQSRPSPVLVCSSLTLVAVGILIPLSPVGVYFDFVKLPSFFFAVLAVMVVAYLLCAELGKRFFLRWHKDA